jgi:hypothetical protein
MDARYFMLCTFAVIGCAESDYAMPCSDCAEHGLALADGTLAISGARGIELRTVSGEGTGTIGPAGATRCSAPEIGGGHVSFSCDDAGSWVCEIASERCRLLIDQPGRAKLVPTSAGLLAIWVGREEGNGALRVFRVGDAIELTWGPAEAFASSQTTRGTHDAMPLPDGARVAWLDRGRRNVKCVDLQADGSQLTEARTWLSVDEGSLAGPLLSGDRLFVTHRDTVDAVRAAPLPEPGLVVAPADAEMVAEGDDDQPEVAALAVAGEHLLLGRMRPDGADLSLLAPDGTETGLGFGLGRPVAAALGQTDGGFVAAWRDGARSSSHFDEVSPDSVVLREVTP